MIRRASSSSTGGGALACALGHSFDVAKDGHVNLMMVGRVSRATGDTAEMLAARRRFLNAGHYTDASNVANALIARALDDFFTRDTGGACSASSDSSKDGSDGTIHCINDRGTVSGSAGSCECECKDGYEGSGCSIAKACTSSADSAKDGTDGTLF